MNESASTNPGQPNSRRTPRVLFGLAVALTIVALFYVEENLRGHWTWQKVKSRWQVSEWSEVIPKPVPDNENFAATPFFRSLFPTPPDPLPGWPKDFNEASGKAFEIHKRLHPAEAESNRKGRKPTDLVAWQLGFEQVRLGTSNVQLPAKAGEPGVQKQAAAAVLEALSPYEPVLNELRRVARRPYSRFPIQYMDENPMTILLPHLARLREICKLLQLRSAAKLALGQAAEALEDVQLMLRLADATKDEASLISALVRIAMLRFASDATWEGICQHDWSDSQLQTLQARFESTDLLPDYARTLKSECAMGLRFIQLVRNRSFQRYDLINDAGGIKDAYTGQERGGHDWKNGVLFFFPKGWFDLEQAQYATLLYRHHVNIISEGSIDVEKCKQAEAEIRKGGAVGAFLHHRVLTSMLLPALEKAASRATEAQTVNIQTAIACALERYRLAHGKLPDNLEEIRPKFIQNLSTDVVTRGNPLKYQRLGETDFMLYSVGWDQQDDGGLVESGSDKRQDWVWRSSPPTDSPHK